MTIDWCRIVEFPRSTALATLLAALLLGGPAAAAPTLSKTTPIWALVGVLNTHSADILFDDAGTNAIITKAEFSTTEYHDVSRVVEGVLETKIKSSADLNALAEPPSSPFTVTVEVTMENDEGETATGTVTFEAEYEEEEVVSVPVLSPPTSTDLEKKAPPGSQVIVGPADAFDNAGTNPVFTAAVFSTTDHYDESGIVNGSLEVTVKTAASLLAMTPQPSDPITVTVEVTMTNEEGMTATGKVALITDYK